MYSSTKHDIYLAEGQYIDNWAAVGTNWDYNGPHLGSNMHFDT